MEIRRVPPPGAWCSTTGRAVDSPARPATPTRRLAEPGRAAVVAAPVRAPRTGTGPGPAAPVARGRLGVRLLVPPGPARRRPSPPRALGRSPGPASAGPAGAHRGASTLRCAGRRSSGRPVPALVARPRRWARRSPVADRSRPRSCRRRPWESARTCPSPPGASGSPRRRRGSAPPGHPSSPCADDRLCGISAVRHDPSAERRAGRQSHPLAARSAPQVRSTTTNHRHVTLRFLAETPDPQPRLFSAVDAARFSGPGRPWPCSDPEAAPHSAPRWSRVPVGTASTTWRQG